MAAADGNTITMRFTLKHTPQEAYAFFLVGSERTVVPHTIVRNDSVTFVLTGFNAEMRGLWNGKNLTGDYIRFRADTTRIPFTAVPELDAASPPHTFANVVPLVGTFQAFIAGKNEIDSSTVASFFARGDSIFGTLIAPDGDYGLLAGTQEADRVRLHRFTGWQAYFVDLRRVGDQWEGRLYSRTSPPMVFTLVPRPVLPAVSSGPKTRAKFGSKPFEFSGIGLYGDTVTNNDPRFKGKAVIVDLMGTWCHNCMDGAPLLQHLYNEFGPRGLEVVGLSFELKDDPVAGRTSLENYANRYGISYMLLFMGSTDPANVGKRLKSQLDDFAAWPTTLFIDRRGMIKSIHVGFRGPGTGEEYQAQVQSFFHETEVLVK